MLLDRQAAPPVAIILRARRWMLAGLSLSIVGTRVIEGGSDGTVAQGVLPLVWVAVSATVSAGLGFAAPLTARLLSGFNPATVLVVSDLVEALLSLLALTAILLAPGHAVPILAAYLLFAAFFPAIADVVEEFYAQQLAQLGPGHALSFNASVYSVLGFIGLVIGMPLGSLVSGRSFTILIAVNMVLSALGVCFRTVGRRTVVTTPVTAQNTEDFRATGARMSVRDFAHALVRSGPTSPALGFVGSMGRTLAGIFVYLWIARTMPWSDATSLGLVVACFGIGATVGPHLAPLARRHMGVRTSLLVSTIAAMAVVAVFAGCVALLPHTAVWPIALGYVALTGALTRMRDVLVTTLRQESFRGSSFVTVMSWSFALTSLGALAGSWAGVGLRIATHPLVGLFAFTASLGVILTVVLRFPDPAHSGPGPLSAAVRDASTIPSPRPVRRAHTHRLFAVGRRHREGTRRTFPRR
ncbi:MFS transporter [Yinghuangia sp. YIM S10712]|uniref:MFS transporter n=1 Tax=Yinghuangia sp. YIM S10712 TaxID=3436930 RepID=UPI003F53287F